MEIWKTIVGYEKYQVSNLGNVKSFNNDKIKLRSISANYTGYVSLLLSSKNVKKRHSVHKLVALTFIPNPLNKLEVNHINGIRNDNRVENLEWVTRSENMKHAWNTGLTKGRCTSVVCTNTNIIYKSIDEASKKNNICCSELSRMLNGKIKNKTSLIFLK